MLEKLIWYSTEEASLNNASTIAEEICIMDMANSCFIGERFA